MRPPPYAVALAAALVIGLPAATLPALADGGASQLWLLWSEPAQGAVHVGPAPVVLVRGRAGVDSGGGDDVVLLIDVSASTLEPAGFDVDGDGRVGRSLTSSRDPHRSFHPRRLCSDRGDTIRAAALAAARGWLEDRAAHESTRVAVVTFDAAARTRAALGASPAELAAALGALERSVAAPAGSDLARGLDAARTLLEASATGRRAVVLLSDGRAERSGSTARRAEAEARAAAARLAAAGVRLHAFGLGAEAAAADLLSELADRTGGSSVAVERLDELRVRLAALELAPLADLAIHNRSSGADGRALRIHPGGGFDAVIALAPGENRLAIRARAADGTERVEERVVRYEPGATPPGAVASDLEVLRARTLEMEMTAAIERDREQARRRVLELEAAVP